jgi:hypothetical protein
MNFSSKYVYLKKKEDLLSLSFEEDFLILESSFCSINNNDFNGDLDTNVATIKFDNLKSLPLIKSGSAIKCENCTACLSSFSKIEGENDQKLWKCEFCDFKNYIKIKNEEFPKDNDVIYKLSPSVENINSEYIIFCIDNSSSMIFKPQNRANQNPPIVDMTKFEALKSEIRLICTVLANDNDYKNKKFALVTFNSSVHSYCDSSKKILINGISLTDKKKINEFIESTGQLGPICDTFDQIIDQISK